MAGAMIPADKEGVTSGSGHGGSISSAPLIDLGIATSNLDQWQKCKIFKVDLWV